MNLCWGKMLSCVIRHHSVIIHAHRMTHSRRTVNPLLAAMLVSAHTMSVCAFAE